MLYRDYVRTLSSRFEAQLDSIAGVYGFDYGDEFEFALIDTLGLILPWQYGVCRGHLITEDGKQAGDDIIIFDRLRFPTLQTRGQMSYRKEHVPIEAAYAFIEAKHKLVLEGKAEGTMAYAFAQTQKVRELWQEAVGNYHLNEPVESRPSPILTGVISRFAQIAPDKEKLEGNHDIDDYLEGFLPEFFGPNVPTFAVFGPDNVMLHEEAPAPAGAAGRFGLIHPTSHVGGLPLSHVATDKAFGIALAFIMWAMQDMRLALMPWSRLIEDAIDDY